MITSHRPLHNACVTSSSDKTDWQMNQLA